jgi:hypothetical protein
MMSGSEWWRAIAGAVVGLLYGSIFAYLSIFAFGGGHGTPIPFMLSSAPLGIVLWIAHDVGASRFGDLAALLSAPLVWAGLGSLVALAGRGKSLRLARILVLLQYASGLALVAIFLPRYLGATFPYGRDFVVIVIVWATVYLLGQVALWWRLSWRNKP